MENQNDTQSRLSSADLLGQKLAEAERRLQEKNETFSISKAFGKKGPVAGANEERVIRCIQKEDSWHLLVSAFCCEPQGAAQQGEDSYG